SLQSNTNQKLLTFNVFAVRSSRISWARKSGVLGLEAPLSGIASENFRSGEAVLIVAVQATIPETRDITL
ncbi:hypothetical protein ACFHZX_005252, partial [Klebsiella pneumoniae]